ncbi:MAG TPA: long-chain fatty aldehyde decarbonylase [Polyangiaceae bacterium]|nr:long-chain fatty aldehyde decarbonylase [Polyangiaceae bacterium]
MSSQLPADEVLSMERLMGLAVFGEKVAARTYALMAELKPEYGLLLREFASMEGRHGTWFHEASKQNSFVPDRKFADNELGYLLAQVDGYRADRDFDALAVLQGFIVECLAISTYDPFVEAAKKYDAMSDCFQAALDEERYHVDWITRYLRLRFFDAEDELLALVQRVNVQGIDCVGGTLMNITDNLQTVGLSGADCAGTMADEYTQLLQSVGVPQREATKNIVSLFMPVMRKYRRGEKTK